MTTEQQIKVLEDSIETVDFQIKTLKDKVNYLQVRYWKKHRARLNRLLKQMTSKTKTS